MHKSGKKNTMLRLYTLRNLQLFTTNIILKDTHPTCIQRDDFLYILCTCVQKTQKTMRSWKITWMKNIINFPCARCTDIGSYLIFLFLQCTYSSPFNFFVVMMTHFVGDHFLLTGMCTLCIRVRSFHHNKLLLLLERKVNL